MKKVLLFAAAQFIFAVIYGQQTAQSLTEDFKKLDWLAGNWTRTNVKPGRSATETWQKTSSSEWTGLGVTMKGSDTTFVEKLKLVVKEENIYFVADLAENKKPVYFKLTKITADSFVCENVQHDFPKVIAYRKDGDKLQATISGDGKSINYIFERK